MLGLLVIIVISWVLLYYIEKKNIEVLGLIPNGKRIIQFAVGIVFIMLVSLINIYVESYILDVNWKLNSKINYTLIFDSFIYHLRSALTEDLVFRGALLYILISKLGAKWAIFISTICFGIYHVFSYGMTAERIVPIVYVVLITGVTGYVWAYTFYKTKSIILGLGFHLGINLIMTFFYSSQPYGELIFTELSRNNFTSKWNELYFLLFKGLFPSIMTYPFVKVLFHFNTSIVQQKNNNDYENDSN